ncbi:co-chaperone protein Sba1p [[Candida] jaroonii]|uniref:Co-chaperone protein Sba1p n=1 Tax=[Candida] jaroonii TaxID=467808 RepID=A0ACA9YF54_9ASCO|nr:co-chaperone protein Sba1p [[Candida] jaroonii]
MSTIAPTVLWAQRSNATEASKNVIYLTIQAVDVKNVDLKLSPNNLKFTAEQVDGDKKYQLDLDLFDEIDVENSSKNLDSGNHIYVLLRKKNLQEEYWPRLTKEKVKLHYIKTDFDKWVDEDEQDEKAEEDDQFGGMGGMPGMGGMGGMPGMEGLGGMGGMPGMEGLGGMGGMPGMPGMPGMGGAGGPGGLDFASMMQQMGGLGGDGKDFDISKLASQLGQAGNLPDLGEGSAEEGEEAEEVEGQKK